MNKKLIKLNARLALYKKALKDYKEAATCKSLNSFYKFNTNKRLNNGFCYYFTKTHGYDVYDEGVFGRKLPELWKQRPRETAMDIDATWFKGGFFGLNERVECLKAAIKLTKERINLHKSK